MDNVKNNFIACLLPAGAQKIAKKISIAGSYVQSCNYSRM